MRRRMHACHMRRRMHACHMRRRMHACHMRRRIHTCSAVDNVPVEDDAVRVVSNVDEKN
jgi:hypothetical protein